MIYTHTTQISQPDASSKFDRIRRFLKLIIVETFLELLIQKLFTYPNLRILFFPEGLD